MSKYANQYKPVKSFHAFATIFSDGEAQILVCAPTKKQVTAAFIRLQCLNSEKLTPDESMYQQVVIVGAKYLGTQTDEPSALESSTNNEVVNK